MDTETLSSAESMRLLAGVPFGRLVFATGDRPQIRPVNFVVDGDGVVIRTAAGSKLATAVRNAIVAFQADQIDPDRHTGWSVTVTGRVGEIRDPAEKERLRALLAPWATGEKEHFLRITPQDVHGLRLTARSMHAAS